MKIQNSGKGFTLVESLVAVSILLIAVVAPMSIIGGSLAQVSTARDQMTAVNLAQEGIEAVRQKRDSNMLDKWITVGSTTVWDAGLATGVDAYLVDSATVTPLVSCGGVCTAAQKIIYQDQATRLYHQYVSSPVGSAKPFSRAVTIADIVAGREKKITSTVTWKTSNGVTKTIAVSESIFAENNP